VWIAAGRDHSSALCSDGALATWGRNDVGQLANGGSSTSLVPALADLSGLPQGFVPRRLSAGVSHGMIFGGSGFAALWGFNASGQIGDNTTATRRLPVPMSADRLLPGDRILSCTSGPTASYTLGLIAEPLAPRIEEWRLLHFQSRENAGNAADSASPAHDGVPNLLKFATGMDPWTFGRPATSARTSGDQLLFTYLRAKAALDDGFQFRIESSGDLTPESWQVLPSGPEIVEDLGPLQRVTVTLPRPADVRLFLRLQVLAE
jgi:hypothetical protein